MKKKEDWLKGHGMTLHPKNTYLQHCAKGVRFVGSVIKPGRKYIAARTFTNFCRKVYWQNELVEQQKPNKKELFHFVAMVNSYLGMMRHYESERLFHRVLSRISADWYRYTYISKRGRSVKLVARPTRRTASRRRAVA